MFPRIHTLAFETVEDPSAAELGGGEEITPEEPAAAAEAPAAVEEPATPAAPAIDWEDPEVQQQIDDRVQAQLEDLEARYAHQYSGQQQQPGDQLDQHPLELPDPLEDPQGYAAGMQQNLVSALEQVLDQRLGPVDEIVQQQRGQEAQDWVSETVGAMPQVASVAELLPAPAEGAEDSRHDDAAQFIELASTGFLAAAEARYGEGPRAVNAAIRAGAAHVEKTLKAVHQAGRKARDAELNTLSGAADDLGGGGGAVDLNEVSDDPYEAARQIVARRQRV